MRGIVDVNRRALTDTGCERRFCANRRAPLGNANPISGVVVFADCSLHEDFVPIVLGYGFLGAIFPAICQKTLYYLQLPFSWTRHQFHL